MIGLQILPNVPIPMYLQETTIIANDHNSNTASVGSANDVLQILACRIRVRALIVPIVDMRSKFSEIEMVATAA
jgi:hypothetical protein